MLPETKYTEKTNVLNFSELLCKDSETISKTFAIRSSNCKVFQIFKHIDQNIRAIPKVKKFAFINDYENIPPYSEQSEQSAV